MESDIPLGAHRPLHLMINNNILQKVKAAFRHPGTDAEMLPLTLAQSIHAGIPSSDLGGTSLPHPCTEDMRLSATDPDRWI